MLFSDVTSLIPDTGNLCLLSYFLHQFGQKFVRTFYLIKELAFAFIDFLYFFFVLHAGLYFFLLLTFSLTCSSLSSFLRLKLRSLIWDISSFLILVFNGINCPLNTVLEQVPENYNCRLEYRHAHSFMCCLWLLSCDSGRVEWLQQRP